MPALDEVDMRFPDRQMAGFVALLAISIGVTASAGESQASGCSLVDLGTLGGPSSTALTVNDQGQVAGNSLTADGENHAFLWTAEDGMLDLGTLGGPFSHAEGMNAQGQVVGYSNTEDDNTHAFSWTARHGMIDLDDRTYDSPSWARAVNDRGEVIGAKYDNAGVSHGFLWTAREGTVDLPFAAQRFLSITGFSNHGQIAGTRYHSNSAFAFTWTAEGGTVDLNLGGRVNEAYAVNERGQVIGASDVPPPPAYHGFLWSARDGLLDLGNVSALALNERGEIAGHSVSTGHAYLRTAHGEMVDLGTLGGPHSSATLVNDRSLVAGTSDTMDGSTHAFAWTDRGGMVDLGTLGGRESVPTLLNGRGQIAGTGDTTDGSTHAFVWTDRGGIVDLGTLGGPDSFPMAMNERGEVVGNSDTADGNTHAFLWSCPSWHGAQSPADSEP